MTKQWIQAGDYGVANKIFPLTWPNGILHYVAFSHSDNKNLFEASYFYMRNITNSSCMFDTRTVQFICVGT